MIATERPANGVKSKDIFSGEPFSLNAVPDCLGSVIVSSRNKSAALTTAITPNDARHLADVLNRAADEAERAGWSATENGGNHDDGGTD